MAIESKALRVAAVTGGAALVVGTLTFAYLNDGADQAPAEAGQDQPVGIMPADASTSPGDPPAADETEGTVEATAPAREDIPIGDEHAPHEVPEGVAPWDVGDWHPTDQESVAMSAVSAYMYMSTEETEEQRQARLAPYFSADAREVTAPLPAHWDGAEQAVAEAELGFLNVVDDGAGDGVATVEVGVTWTQVVWDQPDSPGSTWSDSVTFSVDLGQENGQWKARSLTTA